VTGFGTLFLKGLILISRKDYYTWRSIKNLMDIDNEKKKGSQVTL
jgi:hypothetical protein